MPQPYAPEELMAVVMAREVHNGETAAVGAHSPVPAAACILAEQTHAPEATIIILALEEYYPFTGGSSEFHFLAQRGGLDLFFISGIQIDRHGNFNLHVIGEYRAPRVRAAGAYGSAMLYYMARRVILFRTEHTRRTFVEQVDFVTAAGSSPASVHRIGGPTLLVTPLAVLSFDKEAKGWTLASLHPGVSLEQVQDNTGFPLQVGPRLRVTAPPTQEELRVLRTVVREKLAPAYPEFARDRLLPP
ncbi:MAG: CoA synthetase [Chloroflexi bacterium]|nr:CoA synthetase [Chloroflexota bacterium]